MDSKGTAPHTNSYDDLLAENARLRTYIKIGEEVSVEKDIDKLIPLIMGKISNIFDSERSSIFLIDWNCMELWTKYAEDIEIGKVVIPLKMGFVGMSILTQEIINISNVSNDPRFNSEIDAKTGYVTESVLVAPVFNDEQEVVGSVELLNKVTGCFTDKDERILLETIERNKGTDFYAHPTIARKVIRELKKVIKCDGGSIFLLDKEKMELFCLGSDDVEDDQIRLSINLGIAGLVAMTGKGLNIKDAYEDQRFYKQTDESTGYRTRDIMCAPVRNQSGEVIGVIEVINSKKGSFAKTDMALLRSLTSILGIALENAILFKEQKDQFESLMEVMAGSIDAKDELTAGHSARVTEYSIGIAKELGFRENDIDVLAIAATLHDYGKIGVDDKVLKKEGQLTVDEYEHIKSHVKIGKNILEKIKFPYRYRKVPLIASSHHEYLDGSGYGDGLLGRHIPFMSKIITVADVFEALTADRHYRGALTTEDAFNILYKDADVKFDRNIIDAMKLYWNKSPKSDGADADSN